MRPKTYKILDDAVSAGVGYGIQRAFKHTDSPTQEAIELEVARAVMGAISEVFTFTEEELT